MKKCLIKGMTVIMISTMLASIPVVSYAAETEPKNLTESAVPESDVQNAVNTVDIPETDKESETGGQLPQEQPPQEQPPQEQPRTRAAATRAAATRAAATRAASGRNSPGLGDKRKWHTILY